MYECPGVTHQSLPACLIPPKVYLTFRPPPGPAEARDCWICQGTNSLGSKENPAKRAASGVWRLKRGARERHKGNDFLTPSRNMQCRSTFSPGGWKPALYFSRASSIAPSISLVEFQHMNWACPWAQPAAPGPSLQPLGAGSWQETRRWAGSGRLPSAPVHSGSTWQEKTWSSGFTGGSTAKTQPAEPNHGVEFP